VGDLRNVFGVPPPTRPQGRLVVRRHDFSESQTEYQAARSHEPGMNVFYKDATPRGEHYIRCTVTCEPPQHWAVPLRLTMCYEDMSEVSPQDSSCLKILGDGSRKLVAPRAGAPSTFYYRIELGSFRRADRKFRVQISTAARAPGGPPPVASCATPPLLVLSKKKVEPGREAAPGGSAEPRRAFPDDLRPGQRPTGRKRKAAVNVAVDGVPPEFKDQIAEIHKRLDALDGAISSLTHLIGARAPNLTPPVTPNGVTPPGPAGTDFGAAAVTGDETTAPTSPRGSLLPVAEDDIPDKHVLRPAIIPPLPPPQDG